MKAKQLLKKTLSVALCAALLGGTAVMLPAVSSEVAVTADAAEVYGDFEYEISDNEVTITGYTGSGGDVTIPDKIDGKPVTSIGLGAFYDCTGLTSITIPDSVASIGSFAFSYCVGLTNITIPESVTIIGWKAFQDCTGLKSINLPDGVTRISEESFSGCSGLTSITIPDSVTRIENRAFQGCTGLKSINIPDNVNSIGEYAFKDCIGLKSINIPGSVTEIGWGAFQGCTGITSINVDGNNSSYSSADSILYNKDKTKLIICPAGKTGSITISDSVAEISSGAFLYCAGLTGIIVDENNSVYSSEDGILYNKDKTELITCPPGKTGSIIIPDSVTTIRDSAVYECSRLTSITIPDSVTIIGDYAFVRCTGLKSATIPGSITRIGEYAFCGCAGLKSITIPDSVKSIGYYAFYDCTMLTSINVDQNNTVYSSEDGILYYKNKTTLVTCPAGKSGNITISDSVKTISWYAFAYCSSLTTIKIPDSVTSIGNSAFSDCTGLTSITIPDSVTSIGGSAFNGCKNLTIYGKKGYAAEKYANDNGFKFVAIGGALKNESYISTESIVLNDSVVLNAEVEGGMPDYTYSFMYKAPGATSWKVIGTKFGTSNKETLTPTKAGTYEILISVKDGNGKTESKKFILNVKDNRLTNKSSVSGTDVPCGTKIAIIGAAEGGEGTYLYTYQIKKPGKTSWTTLGDKYGTDTSKVFTAKLSGAYEVRVLVKDGAGTVKSFTATVNSIGTLLTNKSTISTTTATVGDKVTLAAVPEGGTAPYRFTYEYKKPGSTSWKTIGKRGATYKSVSFTAETAGTYQARVYIQDASDYVTVKTFKVTVS